MAASMSGAAIGQITGYVQVNPPNAPQPGGFNTQTGTVGQFNDTGLAANQCVQTGPGGLLSTTGATCGAGGGSGGASSLGVNFNGVSITTPTAQINFFGGPFNVFAVGSTATVTMSQISLSTGVTGSLPAASIAAGNLGPSVVASSQAVNSIYPASVSAGTYSNITLPAPNIASGYLGSMVIISSAAPSSIGVPQLNFTGTPSSSTIARGDGVWASPSSLGLGTITGVVAGAGIVGGGSTGTVTVAISSVNLNSQVSGILPIANGGNGSNSPGILQGSNIIITGSWPNQIINATTSGGGGNTGAQVNTASQYSVPFYSASGSSNTLSGSANFTYNQTTMTVVGAIVGTSVTVSNLTSGQCVQTGAGGILTGTGVACGSGGGGSGNGAGTAYTGFVLTDALSNKWNITVSTPGNLVTTSTTTVSAGYANLTPFILVDPCLNYWKVTVDTTSHLITASSGSYSDSIQKILLNDTNAVSWLVTISTSGNLITSGNGFSPAAVSCPLNPVNATLPLPGGATNYIQVTNTLQAGSTFYVSSGTVNQLIISSETMNSGYLTDTLSLFPTITSSGITYDSYFNHAQLNSTLGVGLGGYYFISASTGTTFDKGALGGSLRLDPSGVYLGYGGPNGPTSGFLFLNGSQSIIGPILFNSTTTFQGNVSISSGVLLNGSAGTNGQVFTSGGPGTIPTWTTISGGGGGSSLAVGTGTTSGYSGAIVSSPTAVVLFDQTLFKSSLQGGSTNFITSISTITASSLGAMTSINSAGNVPITSTATLAAGTNVTLSQLGNTITVNSTASGGGGIVSPGTFTWTNNFGFIVSTLSANAFNATTTSMTVTGPGAFGVQSSSAGQFGLTEGSSITVVTSGTSIDSFWADSSSHTLEFNPNNTSTYTVVGTSATITPGHLLVAGTYIGSVLDGGTVPAGTVTSVTGTPPINSSGGTTPAISLSQTIGQSETITGSSLTVAGVLGLTVTGATNGPLVVISTAPLGVQAVSISSTLASAPQDFMITVSSQNGTTTFAVKYDGDIVSSGTAPSMGTCGSSPSVDGTDTLGVITVGSGIVTSCTMNWANTKTRNPVCTMSTNSTAVTGDITTTTTSSITFGFSATLGGGTINYICGGNKG